ncbi:putative ditrans,polycis-undecaprenyl-diphosphate synthase ((2E,6E)-farnesyl-diphosphate specific) [Medicago truncatula]|uniref:Putative ditrans,polycis-undecaprenyl-diphosphate synthase ((2E,6E)-farnesyl-diphosphate specific) n=1 Tax=Medicago truncatula TaxID=3880 RepID=A0A396HSX7_MEDTR|nr:putative ditrans,polycis-undecaprenyl-diphosphate synthase ((2E,6E)-farnesyl-diphosphate specific) [Medicago truncatula]
MLSLSPPITLITCPPKTTTNPTHASRSQSRRLPSQPMIIIKRGTTVAGSIPNADKAEGRASIDEDLLEVELTQTELRKEMIPKHVAVIMDGNGRWAKMRGLPLSEGHTAGMQSLKTMVKMCLRWEIKVLTIFMFSTDNWIRPKVIIFFFPFAFSCLITNKANIKIFFFIGNIYTIR